MAKLIFIGEKFGDRVYEFSVDKTTVGRGDHNTLTIHDASVSQSHCEILVFGPEVIVRDLGSSNGTLVNGERLHDQQRPLLSGQIVKFGSVEARLELEPPTRGGTATDVTAVHSHARHLLDPHEISEKQPADSMTLDGGTPLIPNEHTLLMPRSTNSGETIAPPATDKADRAKASSNRATGVLIVAALVCGLVILIWLIFSRR